jgi:ribose transport system substrate-binding protein
VPVVGADTNAFIAQLLEGKPGAAVTNPAVIGGVGTALAIQALDGEDVEQETLLTPEVWDAKATPEKLEENNFPDRDANYSAAVEVAPYTTYSPEQLFACKGPGE